MQDFFGFIVSIAILLLLLYLFIHYIIPFVFTWLFPIIAFIIITFYIIRKGRIAPLQFEFDLFIKTKHFLLIVLFAVVLPSAHASIQYLFTDSEYILPIFIFNMAMILLLLIVITRYHLYQRKQYISEGRHVEELMETCQNKINILMTVIEEIKFDINKEGPSEDMEAYKQVIEQAETLIKKYEKNREQLKNMLNFFSPSFSPKDQEEGNDQYRNTKDDVIVCENEFITIVEKAEKMCNCDFISTSPEVPTFLNRAIGKGFFMD